MTGHRETKKLMTRRAISQAAIALFTRDGYDAVTVADVAKKAMVAVTTLFTYFPDGKEALIFELDEDRPEALAAAVVERAPGTSVMAAIEAFMLGRGPFRAERRKDWDKVAALVAATPVLRNYVKRKWTRCEDQLLTAIAECTGRNADGDLRALVRYILEAPDIAGAEPDPRAALPRILNRLAAGWDLSV